MILEISNATQSGFTQKPEPVSNNALSSDFETFLVMLTAQMKNQDPLNPLNSQDFATQLATFSGVEQQVKTNDLLAALTAQFSISNLGNMSGWIGKEVRIAGPTYFSGTPLEIVGNTVADADKSELVVKNTEGEEVQRIESPVGEEAIVWAGVDENGEPISAGSYSFAIVSYANGEVIGQHEASSFARVSEVRNVGGTPTVVLEGGAEVPATVVEGLR